MSAKEISLIQTCVSIGIEKLSEHLQDWTRKHLVTPYIAELLLDPDKSQTAQFWIVTDHVGFNDSSYRVVYNPISKNFGLECTLQDQRHWYMGDYGTFDEALDAM